MRLNSSAHGFREIIMNRSKTILAIPLLLAVALSAGCAGELKRVKTHVRSIQVKGGVPVMAQMDCPAEQSEMNLATNGIRVVWPGHVALVEKERVLVDGAEFTAVPATATNIWLAITNGLFAVRADGVEVKSVSLVK